MLGLPEKLSEMNNKLEEIQKSLDVYLETKRQIFPRFYFLSNDDLLEILGQTRNPDAVQPHLKKCFDNIKSLRISQVHPDTRTLYSQISKEVEAQNVTLMITLLSGENTQNNYCSYMPLSVLFKKKKKEKKAILHTVSNVYICRWDLAV